MPLATHSDPLGNMRWLVRAQLPAGPCSLSKPRQWTHFSVSPSRQRGSGRDPGKDPHSVTRFPVLCPCPCLVFILPLLSLPSPKVLRQLTTRTYGVSWRNPLKRQGQAEQLEEGVEVERD